MAIIVNIAGRCTSSLPLTMMEPQESTFATAVTCYCYMKCRMKCRQLKDDEAREIIRQNAERHLGEGI